ncbi:LADA_0G00144g1_1 [Lachancea dasiensis]|uniref:LADA_0G00144g1_1 n=1 Tax=Lachancea dasiensis TaxID=1072105 RepID=A0A1G4JQ12_9SACH|nr:LADA_0G00144g1_1 [Lachancea dasiensis]
MSNKQLGNNDRFQVGVRLGWIVSQDLQSLENAPSRKDYNIVLVTMVEDAVSCYTLCKENLAILKEFVRKSEGKSTFANEPKSGSVCLLRANSIGDTMRFAAKLATVLAAPGECFGIPGTLRIGYGNSKTELLEALKIITLAYEQHFN